MPRKIELYFFSQSPLFRLGRKADLAELLRLSLSDLVILSKDSNFNEWVKKTPGKKNRIIEEPIPSLAKTLKRLHLLLKRIEPPSYLMSGKVGVKPRDNAEFHRTNGFMINVDIEAFYQSTKREFVYLAFKDLFGQTSDVASLLADLVTYKGHIPTGAATSQIIAFWAYKKTFDRINNLCVANNIRMSIWVDDITFSSDKPFPRTWVKNISKIMSEVELALKVDKTKWFSRKDYKTATGSAISPKGDILVKNAKRKEIIDFLNGRRIEEMSLQEARSLFGKLVSQRQNEKEFFTVTYFRCLRRIRTIDG